MKTKFTHKMQDLYQSEYAPRVHEMLDAGYSCNKIAEYLKDAGYPIACSTLTKYAEIRRAMLMEQEEPIVPSNAIVPYAKDTEVIPPSSHEDRTRKMLLMEFEALDTIIVKGYEAVKKIQPEDITPKLMMDAIRLKNELTGGEHGGLTKYGYNTLRRVENDKWKKVIRFMLSFIPKEDHAEVLRGVEQIEEEAYSGTPWYDEYMRARSSYGDTNG